MAQVRSVAKLAKVKSVYTGNTFSIRTTQEMENGFFVKLGDVEANNIEVHGMVVPQAGDKGLVLIANPAIIYDNTARLGADQERFYFMEAGEVVRGYEIGATDILGITLEGIEGDAVEGEYLVAGNGVKLVPSATPVADAFCAKVIRKEKIGGVLSLNLTQTPAEYVMMEVLTN